MPNYRWCRAIPAAGLLALCCFCPPALGSYAIHVGRNLTTDGSVFTAEAEFPGRMIEIPQARQTYRFLRARVPHGLQEARTELLYGLRRPQGETMSGMGTPGVSCSASVKEAPDDRN